VSQADIDAIVSLGEGNATTRLHYQSGCWISLGVARLQGARGNIE